MGSQTTLAWLTVWKNRVCLCLVSACVWSGLTLARTAVFCPTVLSAERSRVLVRPSLLPIAFAASVNLSCACAGFSACSVVLISSWSCMFRSQAPFSLVVRVRKPAGAPDGVELLRSLVSRAGNSTRRWGRRPVVALSAGVSARPGPGLSCMSPASKTRRKRYDFA